MTINTNNFNREEVTLRHLQKIRVRMHQVHPSNRTQLQDEMIVLADKLCELCEANKKFLKLLAAHPGELTYKSDPERPFAKTIIQPNPYEDDGDVG